MTVSPQPAAPIRDLADLRRHFQAGEKAEGPKRLGVEHEKVGVLADGRAPAYDEGIRQLLARLSAESANYGWTEVKEAGVTIALKRSEAVGSASVTLEPGGQVELSDAPRVSAVDARDAIEKHLAELAGPARDLGLHFLGVGFRPFGTLEDVPWMPKGRYRVMREYLPTRGAMAHEMMKRTTTVQVNADYADQADAASKMRAAMGTSSLVTALWAASPLVDGRATDYQSYRAACWLQTDDDRCGLLPFVFDDKASEHFYQGYTDWALDVPMFFVHRGDTYTPAHGMTFRRFLAEGFEGERATMVDWELHLSTLFPEVRLKQYLEMRGADAGPLPMVYALPALYRGLMYDASACAEAWRLVADWSYEERLQLRREVPRGGLRTRVRGKAIQPLAKELVAIARAGLMRLGAHDDAVLLEPIERIADSGRTVADEVRELHARHNGDPKPLIEALALPLA